MKFLKTDIIFSLVLIILAVWLILKPTGFERAEEKGTIREKAIVLETNESDVSQLGIVKTGEQTLKIKILTGKFEGEVVDAGNLLFGKMEFDKIFSVGDKILAVINLDENGDLIDAQAIDHYRLNVEFWLLLLFVAMLIGYAGFTGFKAVISFGFTGLFIWKVLLPGFLKGYDPVLLSLGVVLVLTGAIIFLVGGLNKKGITAFFGASAGVLLTCVLSIFFTDVFQIHGAVKPFSETLLYSGFAHLDLTEIFLAGIFIASSGAVMDIAMDIAASQHEIIEKRPDISRKELILSGFRVGRAVVGTMTTTLLLAYSGGFTALMMVFMAQGTPVVNILNLNYVSAEILHTLVGSFGLVTVAPLTAIAGGVIYINNKD